MEPRKFDIVWFTEEHAKEAMNSLALLPDEEHASRGKTHHFRFWENCPVDHPTAMKDDRFSCVATDKLGSVELSPGRRLKRDGSYSITSYSENGIIEVKPGFYGAHIRPEVWGLPNFVKAAKLQAQLEQKNKLLIKPKSKTPAIKKQVATADAPRVLRRFFVTVARMTMQSGTVSPHELIDEELQDIYTMAVLNRMRLPLPEEWLEELLAAPTVEEEQEPEPDKPGPYDPLSFLAYANKLLAATG